MPGVTGAPVVHMDNLYEGWDGLPRIGPARGLLRPLSGTGPGATGAGTGTPTAGPRSWWSRPRPCWCSRASAPAPGPTAALITVLAWVEVPADLRLERGLARDGVDLDEHLPAWAVAEAGALRPGGHPGAGRPASSTAPGVRPGVLESGSATV